MLLQTKLNEITSPSAKPALALEAFRCSRTYLNYRNYNILMSPMCDRLAWFWAFWDVMGRHTILNV